MDMNTATSRKPALGDRARCVNCGAAIHFSAWPSRVPKWNHERRQARCVHPAREDDFGNTYRTPVVRPAMVRVRSTSVLYPDSFVYRPVED